MDYEEVLLARSGDEPGRGNERRRWWDVAIVALATIVFVWLGVNARMSALAMNLRWIVVLTVALLASLLCGGWVLWRRTRFS